MPPAAGARRPPAGSRRHDADQDRLQDTGGLDRCGQFLHRRVIETGAGLERVGPDVSDRGWRGVPARSSATSVATPEDQRLESSAQGFPMHGSGPPLPTRDSSRRRCCGGRRARSACRTRGFTQPDIPWDDCLTNPFGKELTGFVRDLLGEVQAGVEHGEQHPLDPEPGVE